jgi:hypothetical protein
VCGDSLSTKQSTISCGVPQGFVLGPLLFLLYINDFSNCSSVLDLHLFADDANLFYSDKKLSDLELVLNVEFGRKSTYGCAPIVIFKLNKSNFVIFHSSQKKPTSNVTLTVNSEILKEEKCVKYLTNDPIFQRLFILNVVFKILVNFEHNI